MPTFTTSKPQTIADANRVQKGQTQRVPNLEHDGAATALASGLFSGKGPLSNYTSQEPGNARKLAKTSLNRGSAHTDRPRRGVLVGHCTGSAWERAVPWNSCASCVTLTRLGLKRSARAQGSGVSPRAQTLCKQASKMHSCLSLVCVEEETVIRDSLSLNKTSGEGAG